MGSRMEASVTRREVVVEEEAAAVDTERERGSPLITIDWGTTVVAKTADVKISRFCWYGGRCEVWSGQAQRGKGLNGFAHVHPDLAVFGRIRAQGMDGGGRLVTQGFCTRGGSRRSRMRR